MVFCDRHIVKFIVANVCLVVMKRNWTYDCLDGVLRSSFGSGRL
jgi:hypothetical protein